MVGNLRKFRYGTLVYLWFVSKDEINYFHYRAADEQAKELTIGKLPWRRGKLSCHLLGEGWELWVVQAQSQKRLGQLSVLYRSNKVLLFRQDRRRRALSFCN